MATEAHLAVLPVAPAVRPAERERLVRRARLLAWVGLGWHVAEAAVAIGAGVVAGSVALVGFGADSLIEAAAGLVVLWLMIRLFVTLTNRLLLKLPLLKFPLPAQFRPPGKNGEWW